MLPKDIAALTEETSIALANQIQFAAVQTPLAESPIQTSYVSAGEGLPLLLLHGFDSSIFEFRRLVPELTAYGQVWAVDLLGFGFSDRLVTPRVDPEAIRLHLYSFWQQMIGEPVVLVGASMGGAAALDWSLSYPEAVQKLVLIDSAGITSGPALGRFIFPPLDSWAAAFLRNPRVRRGVSQRAYHDQSWVTADAERCATLHLQAPGWQSALIAFTKSGGYRLGKRIQEVAVPTLILWGEQDRILGTKDAQQFERAIPQSQLVWIPECGHVPHLEKARVTGEWIGGWM